MEGSVKDILRTCLENLEKSDYKNFRIKLLDVEKTGGITKSRIEGAKTRYELAVLLNEIFVDDAVNTTVHTLKSIGCNAKAKELRDKYDEIQQTQRALVRENASDSASSGTQSSQGVQTQGASVGENASVTQSSQGDEGTSSHSSQSKTAEDRLCQQTQRASVEKIASDSPSYGTQSSKDIKIQQLSDPTPVYTMNSKPRGTCVIFNNVNFVGREGRTGSDKDADALRNTFQWLGFIARILTDRTMQDMKDDLEDLRKTVTGDCFVCCVLSHGDETGVNGSDNNILSVDDILSPFSGDRCTALAGKPKVFFIQTCRGAEMPDKVNVEADFFSESKPDSSLDQTFSIPGYADFLLSMSTLKGFVALRDPQQGSWFIQSLCKQLAESCPNGEDILSILTKVNNDVSAKEASLSGKQAKKFRKDVAKQCSESRFSLRKKLVFHVAE